jgi:hypothetical protein
MGTPSSNSPAADTAAVITLAALPNSFPRVLDQITWSYSAAPTNGNVKVESPSGNIVHEFDVTAGGPGFIPFPRGLDGTAGAAMIITLAAGGGAVSGIINVTERNE